jgi:hypothetical protein
MRCGVALLAKADKLKQKLDADVPIGQVMDVLGFLFAAALADMAAPRENQGALLGPGRTRQVIIIPSPPLLRLAGAFLLPCALSFRPFGFEQGLIEKRWCPVRFRQDSVPAYRIADRAAAIEALAPILNGAAPDGASPRLRKVLV